MTLLTEEANYGNAMSSSIHTFPRLYVAEPLCQHSTLLLPAKPSHYLLRVMRLKSGDGVVLFNGQAGEWQTELKNTQGKQAELYLTRQLRAQSYPPDLWLVFAPIKSKRINLMLEKATELGVRRLLPVKTERTIVSRLAEERLLAHCIEAAEQTGRMDIPHMEPFQPLSNLLNAWPEDRLLLYGDETGTGIPIARYLFEHQQQAEKTFRHYAILVGPEGGFSPNEHQQLKAHPSSQAIGLGPRVLRADTAAIAALACLQALCGDWDGQPAFRNT